MRRLVLVAALLGAGCTKAGSPVCDDAARKAPKCGGIANLACPSGLRCVDDPCDTCDPAKGGRDCGGVCLPR